MTVCRTAPHDLIAEEAVLYAVLMDSDSCAKALSILLPEDFYSPAHARIFEAVIALTEESRPVDAVTVGSWLTTQGSILAVGGVPYLAGLVDNNKPTVTFVEEYARTVRGKALARQLITTCQQIVNEGYAGVDDAESYLLSAEGRIRDVVAAAEDGNAKSTTTMFDASRSFVKKLFDMATTPAKRGLRTGIGPLDDILLPMQPAQMIIVAARTGVGKTSFALNLADACVGGAGGSERGGALFFTAEMTREQLALRAISARTKIDGTRLAAGYTTDEDWPKLQAAIDGMRHLPLWVNDESDLTISIIRQQIRAVKAEIKQRNMVDEETGEPVKLRMVVVDYLQLLGSDDAPGNKNSNREQEVARLSRGLKRISKSESLTVIALSQLSRKVEDRASKKPMLSDLRESGSIEQDADSILFLYRDDYYDNETANKDTAEIIVAKQRGGKTGTAVVGFDRGLTQFHSGQFRLPGFVRDLAARQSTQCRE